MNKSILEKKIKFASQEELLFLLLNNTDFKFQQVIALWKENNVEGTILAGKLMDNLLELKSTLNVDIAEGPMREALINIRDIYSLIIDEISKSSIRKDYERLEKSHKLFLQVKEIFDEDRRNIQKSKGI